MANTILDVYGASTALTISLGGLASSTAGVGRQTDMVANATPGVNHIRAFGKFKLGTSPAAGSIYCYVIRGDNGNYRSDNAGASDAAWTQLNAPPGGYGRTKGSPATGDVVFVDFTFFVDSLEWGIGVVHDTTVALDATGGNHFLRYITISPQVQ